MSNSPLSHACNTSDNHNIFNAIDHTNNLTFDVVCSNCNEQSSIDSTVFYPQREDLKSFLQSSFDGSLILYHYEKHGNLHSSMQNQLAQLLINRELYISMKKNNVSLLNPFHKIEIPFETLEALAQEIKSVFDIRPGIFINKGQSENGKRTPSTGKFITQMNYSRQVAQIAGIASPKPRSIPLSAIENNTEIQNHISVIEGDHDELTEEIENSWKETFLVHQELCHFKKNTKADLLDRTPLLRKSFASQLIIFDFNRKFPDKCSPEILSTWPGFRNCLENFIKTKLIRSEEGEHLLSILPNLTNEQKDVVLLLLLSSAIKAPEFNPRQHVNKKKKVDEVADAKSKAEREQFIVHIEKEEDLDEVIAKKGTDLQADTVHAYLLVVGPVNAPQQFYAIAKTARFPQSSVIDALDICFKLILTYNFGYSKASHNLWMFLQRAFFRMSQRSDKMNISINKAITFVEKFLNVTIE